MKVKVYGLIRKALRVGFFHLLSANLLLQIAGFGGQMFLTKILSVEDIGRIRVAQSFFGIILIIASLGINTAILKLCSEKITEKERKEIFLTGFRITLISSTVLLIVIYLLARLNIFSSDTTINNLLKIYGLQIPLFVITSLGVSFLQSQKKIKTISRVQSYSKLFVIIFSTVSAIIFGLFGYVQGLLLSNFVSFIWMLYFMKNELKDVFRFQVNAHLIRKIITLSGYAFGTSISWQLMMSLGIIMANFMVEGSKDIAYYGIASLIITTMMMIPGTINQIMIPYISEETKNYNKVKEILVVYQKRMFVVMLTVVVISYVTLPILIPFAFGEKYINSLPYFKIMLLGLFFWSIYSPKHNTLMSVGRIDLNLYANIYTVLISVILNFLLITSYGIYGAAIASSSTFFVAIFINSYFYQRVFGSKNKGFKYKFN